MAESTNANAGWVGGTGRTCSAEAKRAWPSVAMTTGDALCAR